MEVDFPILPLVKTLEKVVLILALVRGLVTGGSEVNETTPVAETNANVPSLMRDSSVS